LYPEPYFDKEVLDKEHEEIRKNGFEPDTILITQTDLTVYGLNIAIGWPFPAPLKEPYEKFFHELSILGPDTYLYPYANTHITVMTLVNFKEHQYPGEEVKEIKELVPEIFKLVSRELHEFKPFKIDMGPPVILKRAAIIPILNPTGEVLRFREKIRPLLENTLSLKVESPKGVHSTILRFLKCPPDVNGFIAKFESIAANTRMGEVAINELLLTSETKPYMRDGEILHHFRLGDL